MDVAGLDGRLAFAVPPSRAAPDPGRSGCHVHVDRVVDRLKRQIDNSYLNSVPGLEVPSLENVARWIWARKKTELPGLIRECTSLRLLASLFRSARPGCEVLGSLQFSDEFGRTDELRGIVNSEHRALGTPDQPTTLRHLEIVPRSANTLGYDT